MDTKEIILAIENKQNQWEAYTYENLQFKLIERYTNFNDLRIKAPCKVLEEEKVKFERPKDATERQGFGNFSIYQSNSISDEVLKNEIFIAKLMDEEKNYEFIGLSKDVKMFNKYCKMADGISVLDSFVQNGVIKSNYLLFISEGRQEYEPMFSIWSKNFIPFYSV
jgi:hypothetical protein